MNLHPAKSKTNPRHAIHYLQYIYLMCAVHSAFVTVYDKGGQLDEPREPHFRRQIREEPCTVKPAYNGNARDRNFFPCEQVPFNTGTWILDPRNW
jgi:hypothetical protein